MNNILVKSSFAILIVIAIRIACGKNDNNSKETISTEASSTENYY